MEINVKNPSEEMLNASHHIECKRISEVYALDPKTPTEQYLAYAAKNAGSSAKPKE